MTREIRVRNKLGLHARPAAMIAKAAAKAVSEVRIVRDGEAVDAKSVIDVLSMACPAGTTLAVTADDPLDGKVLDEIEALFNSGFNEE